MAQGRVPLPTVCFASSWLPWRHSALILAVASHLSLAGYESGEHDPGASREQTPSPAAVFCLGGNSHQVSDPASKGTSSILRSPPSSLWLAWIQDWSVHDYSGSTEFQARSVIHKHAVFLGGLGDKAWGPCAQHST